jgi:hypothetical protein
MRRGERNKPKTWIQGVKKADPSLLLTEILIQNKEMKLIAFIYSLLLLDATKFCMLLRILDISINLAVG